MAIHWCGSIGMRFAKANYRSHGDAKHRKRVSYRLYDSREDLKAVDRREQDFERPLCTDRR